MHLEVQVQLMFITEWLFDIFLFLYYFSICICVCGGGGCMYYKRVTLINKLFMGITTSLSFKSLNIKQKYSQHNYVPPPDTFGPVI